MNTFIPRDAKVLSTEDTPELQVPHPNWTREVTLPSGKVGRRAIGINEIVGYDSPNDASSFVEVFRWDPLKDTFAFVGHVNSYILEHRIAPRKGIPSNKKRQIYSLVTRRARILEKPSQSGVRNFHGFCRIMAKTQRDGIY